MKIGFLINYRAKGVQKKKITPLRIKEFFGEDVHIYDTYNVSEIRPAIAKILDAGVELLAICGGDGTVHLCLSELLNLCTPYTPIPSLLILKGGTMNVCAENLASARNAFIDLHALSIFHNNYVIDSPHFIKVSPLKIQCELWNEPKYGFVFSNGVSFNILRAYYQKEGKSATKAFNITSSIIAGAFISKEFEQKFFRSIKTNISINGSLFKSNEVKITVATPFVKLLLWFSPFDTSLGLRNNDFYFLANAMSTGEIAKRFWPLCRGKYQGEKHFSGTARIVEMQTEDGFTIDGEIYNVRGRINLKIEPSQSLKFLNLNSLQFPHLLSNEEPTFPPMGAII